jgi:hypothetical protein
MYQIPVFESAQQARDYFSKLQQQKAVGEIQDIPISFSCAANSANTATVTVSENPCTILGYNISYTLQASGAESLFIRIKESKNNKQFANALVPISLIATPGAMIPGVQRFRYGEREWFHTLSAKETIGVEWQNISTTTDLVVYMNFRTFQWKI